MIELADAFIALPGGIGTVEELMAVWSMNQLGETDKPAGLLNVADFFSPFLAFLDRMVETKFLPSAHRGSIAVDSDPASLIEKLRVHERTTAVRALTGRDGRAERSHGRAPLGAQGCSVLPKNAWSGV